MAVQTIKNPNEQAVSVTVSPGQTIAFDFALDTANFDRAGNNLTITLEDGGQIVLNNFFVADDLGSLPPLRLADGTEVKSGDFLASFDIDLTVTPAAADIPSSGINPYDNGAADLADGLQLSDDQDSVYWGVEDSYADEFTALGVLGAGAGGPGDPSNPPYNARAVLYEPSPAGKNLSFNINLSGNVDIVDGGKYVANIINNLDGTSTIELSADAIADMLAAMATGGGNVYDYITVRDSSGVEHTIQVVLNQNGDFVSSDEDLLNPPGSPILGEWHTQNSFTDEIRSYSSDGSRGDEIWLAGIANDGYGHNVFQTFEAGGGGPDVIHVRTGIMASGAGNTNTLQTGQDAGNSITVGDNVKASHDAENTLISGKITVNSSSGGGGVLADGGKNTLDAGQTIEITTNDPDDGYGIGVSAQGGGGYVGENSITAGGDISITAVASTGEAIGVSASYAGATNTITAGSELKINAEYTGAGGPISGARNAYGVEVTASGAKNILTADGVKIDVLTKQASDAAAIRATDGSNEINSTYGLSIEVNNAGGSAVGLSSGGSYAGGLAPGGIYDGQNTVNVDGDVTIELVGSSLIGLYSQNQSSGGNILKASDDIVINMAGVSTINSIGMLASDNGYNEISSENGMVRINAFGKFDSAVGMQASANSQPGSASSNVINAENVEFNLSSNWENYGMRAIGANNTNTINAGITVTINTTASISGDFAMYAAENGINTINLKTEAGQTDGRVELTGDIFAETNATYTDSANYLNGGAGDDTFVLNGQVSGAFIIDGGLGNDTLVLKAETWADFDTKYSSWLSDDTVIQNIDSISVDIGVLSLADYNSVVDFMGSHYGGKVDIIMSDDFAVVNYDLIGLDPSMHLTGGLGEQILNVDGLHNGASSDFSLSDIASFVDGFEHIDLTGGADNTLTIDSLLDGLNIDSSYGGGVALRISGDADDSVAFSAGSSWAANGTVETYNGVDYAVYSNNDPSDPQYLLIQTGLL